MEKSFVLSFLNKKIKIISNGEKSYLIITNMAHPGHALNNEKTGIKIVFIMLIFRSVWYNMCFIFTLTK